MGKWITCTLLVIAVLLRAPLAADACSCGRPIDLGFGLDDGPAPLGTAGALWLSGRPPKTAWFSVEKIAGSKRKRVPFAIKKLRFKDAAWTHGYNFYVIAPRKMVSGETYVFATTKAYSKTEAHRRTLAISDAALLWQAPAKPRVSAVTRQEFEVGDVSGSCSSRIEAATVDVSPALPPAMAPFAGQLLYRVLVDGKPWEPQQSLCSQPMPGRSWTASATSPSTHRVFRRCSGSPDADAGVGKQRAMVVIEMLAPAIGGADPSAVVVSLPVELDLPCA